MEKVYGEAHKLLKKLKASDTKIVALISQNTEDKNHVHPPQDLASLQDYANSMKDTTKEFKTKLGAMSAMISKVEASPTPPIKPV